MSTSDSVAMRAWPMAWVPMKLSILPAPGPGGVEKGAPGNPEKTEKGSGQPSAEHNIALVDAPAVRNEKPDAKPVRPVPPGSKNE